MYSKSMKAVALAAMTGALCAVPLIASAQVVVLPGYTVNQRGVASAQRVTSNITTSTSLGGISGDTASPAGTIGAGDGNFVGSVSGTPMPVLQGEVSAALNPGTITPPNAPLIPILTAAAGYHGELTYYFEVLGPGSAATILINEVGKLGVSSSSPNGIVDANLNLNIAQLDSRGNDVGDVLLEHAFVVVNGDSVVTSPGVSGALDTGLTGGFQGNGIFTLQTNTLYMVDMSVDLGAHVDGTGHSVTSFGYIDPLFSIAPDMANGGAYSFIFSDGIGNSPLASGGVPEPSAWAMMLLGFGTLGAVARRRRARPAPAA